MANLFWGGTYFPPRKTRWGPPRFSAAFLLARRRFLSQQSAPNSSAPPTSLADAGFPQAEVFTGGPAARFRPRRLVRRADQVPSPSFFDIKDGGFSATPQNSHNSSAIDLILERLSTDKRKTSPRHGPKPPSKTKNGLRPASTTQARRRFPSLFRRGTLARPPISKKCPTTIPSS